MSPPWASHRWFREILFGKILLHTWPAARSSFSASCGLASSSRSRSRSTSRGILLAKCFPTIFRKPEQPIRDPPSLLSATIPVPSHEAGLRPIPKDLSLRVYLARAITLRPYKASGSSWRGRTQVLFLVITSGVVFFSISSIFLTTSSWLLLVKSKNRCLEIFFSFGIRGHNLGAVHVRLVR